MTAVLVSLLLVSLFTTLHAVRAWKVEHAARERVQKAWAATVNERAADNERWQKRLDDCGKICYDAGYEEGVKDEHERALRDGE